jgi:preprotein translocase subunit Sss1
MSLAGILLIIGLVGVLITLVVDIVNPELLERIAESAF